MNKNPIRFLSSLLLSLSLVLASCHKQHAIEPTPPSGSDVDIYVVGNDGSGAKLWKNGMAVTLSSGNDAADIAISGNDVYIAGYESRGNSVYTAKYWKNGVAVNLSDGTRNAFAYGIAVQGNDVYVAGRELTSGKASYTAKYWKNGIAVPLSDGSENASLAGIALMGSDVYAIGMHNRDGGSPVACYWKNGQPTNLSNESTYAEQQSISISGGDVYLMWTGTYNDQGLSRTSYSKNFGPTVTLKDAAQNFQGHDITGSGSDVYVAGFGISTTGNVFTSTYFKNGIPVAVTNGPKSDYATSIAINGKDIYVAGWTENVGDSKYPTACYWKNGKMVLLGDMQSQSLARKILVIEK